MSPQDQLRRGVFLPLYFTVISLMVRDTYWPGQINMVCCIQVPLALWAAWGIYSEPGRYRSLFPHNEARKQAVASE